MKKTISLILGISLCLSLGACGKEEKAVETIPTVPSTAAAVPETVPVAETTIPAVTTVPTETTMPAEPIPEPEDGDLVRVQDFIPDIVTELKYATEDNFTGQVIYDFQDAYLRYGTVKKLQQVQEVLREVGLGLKIWDGFRPVSAQFKLWEVCPDDTYVADPRKGYSNHNRGCAVDVTMVDLEGNEVEMPTGFDDFSGRADRNYAECPESVAENAMLLQTTMENHGFKGYYGEWWHFNDTIRYEVAKDFTVPQ